MGLFRTVPPGHLGADYERHRPAQCLAVGIFGLGRPLGVHEQVPAGHEELPGGVLRRPSAAEQFGRQVGGALRPPGRGQVGGTGHEQVRGLGMIARPREVPARFERIVEHVLTVPRREPVQPAAASGGADQPGEHVVVHKRVQAGPGRVPDQLPAAQFLRARGDVERAVEFLAGLDELFVEQVNRVAEDGKQ